MKRILYEWGVILFAAISILGVAYWGVSLGSDVADFELSIGRGSAKFQMAAYDGRFLFCDHLANLEVIEAIDSGGGFEPKPTNNINWRVPGLEFHHISLAGSTPVWSLSTSVVILVILSVLMCVLCFRGLRRAILQTAKCADTASQQRTASEFRSAESP